jgi:uncharacterized membrane protein (UPF0127 family)
MSHFRNLIANIPVLIAIQALTICLLLQPISSEAAQLVEIRAGGMTYRVEVARTSAQRRQGLMHRSSLDRQGGMLLVYRKTGDHRIWMKNMRIALRVYWIDDDATVIEMQRLEPCQQSPCPVYFASRPSRYVLELSDHDHPLKVGDRIDGLKEL